MQATDIKTGMTIYGRDGTTLGQVTEVFAQTTSHGHLPVSRYLMQDYGPVRGTSALLAVAEGYVEVRQASYLASAGRTLYVPLQDIHQVTADTCATLKFGADLCETRFVARPEVMAQAA